MAEDGKNDGAQKGNEAHERKAHAGHQASHTAHESRGKPNGNMMAIGIAVVIILLIVVSYASYSIGFSSGSKGAKSVGAPGTVNTQNLSALAPTTTVIQTQSEPTQINASAYSGFLNVSNVDILIGPSTYTAYVAKNASQLNTTLSGLMPNYYGYTITSEYIIGYTTLATENVSGQTESSGDLQEILLLSNNSHSTYAEGLSIYSGELFNSTVLQENANFSAVSAAFNATVLNMTYTYSTYTTRIPGPNVTANVTWLLGYKGNTTVFYQMVQPQGIQTNVTELATMISGHLG